MCRERSVCPRAGRGLGPRDPEEPGRGAGQASGDARSAGARLLEILEFTLGQERYAFPSSYVREVFPLTEITPLPGLPPYILGVVNVRGRILSVMDIRRLLDFGNVGLTNLNKAIILHARGHGVGGPRR